MDAVVGCGPCWAEVCCSTGASLFFQQCVNVLKLLVFGERQLPWRNVAV